MLHGLKWTAAAKEPYRFIPPLVPPLELMGTKGASEILKFHSPVLGDNPPVIGTGQVPERTEGRIVRKLG